MNSHKALSLKPLIHTSHLKGGRVVAVADGANDLEFFKLADVRIAFNAQDVVKRASDYIVDGKDLNGVKEIIESLF